MRIVFILVVAAFACACGTIRYRVEKPSDGRKAFTSIQWDVVEFRFNKLWKDATFSE
ncbi:hypothetical protein CCP3SC1AL1_110011 [Gammaproteobacteria bacterium]